MYKSEQLKPYGAEGTKQEQVEAMFDNIAPTYDKMNHALSFGVDKLWRRAAINYLKPFFTAKNKGKILDVATGTGDFALLAYQKLLPLQIIGCDISEGMMQIAKEKVANVGLAEWIAFHKEDCSTLSFADNSFEAVISAFSLRNFQNLAQCFSEMHRVMKPDGHLSVIDLCMPVSFPMKQLFWLYSHTVMPLLGHIMSKDAKAYDYLPKSMSVMPPAEEMRSIIANAGFRHVEYRRLAFGLCMLYTAEK